MLAELAGVHRVAKTVDLVLFAGSGAADGEPGLTRALAAQALPCLRPYHERTPAQGAAGRDAVRQGAIRKRTAEPCADSGVREVAFDAGGVELQPSESIYTFR